jgi:hypothetical protein
MLLQTLFIVDRIKLNIDVKFVSFLLYYVHGKLNTKNINKLSVENNLHLHKKRYLIPYGNLEINY